MSQRMNIFSFTGRMRVLHLSWMAFFITFLMWFGHAPLMGSIRDTFGLSQQQVQALLVLNVALTIPARILIGMLVDTFGPRRMYSLLLVISGLLCFAFASADSYERLALTRFLLGFVGAGFVVGIRLISEWFPARELGFAEGIYGGLGNFGAAAAAITLPGLALLFGGDEGWRWAVASTGLIAMLYAIVFFKNVSDTPKGSTYFKPKRSGAMEVTSPGDFILYTLTSVPLFLSLMVLAWTLGPGNLELLSTGAMIAAFAVCLALFGSQFLRSYQINSHVFKKPVPEFDRYRFRQVTLLSLCYMATFGSELAVVSMLPLYFMDTFGISQLAAGLVGGSFVIMNLFARPAGGLISDRYGRKRVMSLLLTGTVVGYLLMSQMGSWPLALAIAATVFCSLFVQAGCGGVYSMVPLVKRRMTGQVAGMVGAYGNVGGVIFLSVLSFVAPALFFAVLGLTALTVLVMVHFLLEEPPEEMAEVLEDGTVQIVKVD